MQSKQRQIINMPLIKAMFLYNCLFIINIFIAVYSFIIVTVVINPAVITAITIGYH